MIVGEREVGGLVEISSENVTNSYSTGTVNGDEHMGGFVGQIEIGGYVSNCTTTGLVSGIRNVGGLVGYMWVGFITSSNSTGRVSGNEHVGGLVGANHGHSTAIRSYVTN